jgi:hypothetical protein
MPAAVPPDHDHATTRAAQGGDILPPDEVMDPPGGPIPPDHVLDPEPPLPERRLDEPAPLPDPTPGAPPGPSTPDHPIPEPRPVDRLG